MAHLDTTPSHYGLMAEFSSASALVAAARRAREAGYTKLDAYSPFPIEELNEALKLPRNRVPLVVLLGGLTGLAGGYGLEYWASVIEYPLNIGGRPYFSWPSFVPITFEMMVLTTALSGLFGLLAICGLPRYNHPLFNSRAFDRATRDRFFVCIEATDPKFDLAATRAFLNDLHPLSVEEVME